MNPQTREKTTEKDYYKKASSLMIKAYKEALEEDHEYSEKTVVIKHNEKKMISMDIKFTAIWASKNWASNLLPRSWRYYRASIIFMAELNFKKNKITEKQFLKIKELLSKTKSGEKGNIESRTSNKKKKSINIKEIKELDDCLKISKNKWSNPLRLWIRAAKISGLRPIEWKTAYYEKDINSIIVTNAKNTNGRAIGKFRTINLDHIDESKIKDITLHIKVCESMLSKQSWDVFYSGCSNLLKYSTRKLWPNKNKYPTLYSCRHQFSADLKATGCSKKEVAALMGHASDLTATEHYGKKIHGTRGNKKPKVNRNELNKVRTNDKPNFTFDKK
jgi:integrase